MILCIALSLIACLGSASSLCVPWTAQAPAPVRSEPNSIAFDLIQLERTECYSLCPVYRVAIHGDGRVEYEGINFVLTKGSASKRLTPEQVQALGAAVARSRFFSLRAVYAAETDGCDTVVTCSPSAITTVVAGGREKRIEHYLGCYRESDGRTPYPKELTALEHEIDEIVGTRVWVGTPAEVQLHMRRGDP